MIQNFSLFSLVVLLFTACGSGGSTVSSNNDSNSDVTMSCQPVSLSFFQNKKSSTTNITIKNPNTHPNFLLHNLSETETDLSSSTLAFNNAGLYALFQSEYYWADQTPTNFDYTAYTTPQSLIDDIKQSVDKWSFAITKDDYADLITQTSGGFGFSCQDVSNGCQVTYVRIDSPADKVGLKRGDVISQINEENATHELVYSTAETLDVLNSFTIERDNSNEICSCQITPRDYSYKVAQAKIVNTPQNEKVAYFRFDSFLGTQSIIEEIDEAFDTFKQAGISKLVIDLRYNGGGSVDIASTLLNKLTTTHEEATQFTLAWNDDYQQNNETHRFITQANSLELEQLLFLTTNASASASELVISAMKPYMGESNVIVIGDDTHGKPVGMTGKTDTNYYYFLINFVVKNALGFYNYFDGLPVTEGCNIADDPFHEMGDENELMLKSALNYVDTGSCQ